MSATEPDLPRDPAEYRPKPLLGVGFWVIVVFGLICVLAGVAVAVLGPRLMSAAPATPALVTTTSATQPVATLTPSIPRTPNPHG